MANIDDKNSYMYWIATVCKNKDTGEVFIGPLSSPLIVPPARYTETKLGFSKIVGTVTDKENYPIKDVKVTLAMPTSSNIFGEEFYNTSPEWNKYNETNGLSLTTGDDGKYEFNDLPKGKAHLTYFIKSRTDIKSRADMERYAFQTDTDIGQYDTKKGVVDVGIREVVTEDVKMEIYLPPEISEEELKKSVPNISSLSFGDDILSSVKAKLALRQEFGAKGASGAKFGEAIENVKKQYEDIEKSVSRHALDYETDFTGINADLSSRTPFARVWTALQVKRDPQETWEFHSLSTGNTLLIPADYQDKFLWKRQKDADGIERIYKKPNLKDVGEPQIYMLGNNETSNINEPNEPVEIKDPITDIIQKDIIPIEEALGQNEFLRPFAGITSVVSETEGPLGLIKKTTVNFTIHNFHDYDKIYSKYFLRPGAQIFIDFGWDTATLYDPKEALKSTKGYRRGLDEYLWGVDGKVTDAAGDLETIIGYVTNYNATINENGSANCYIELMSQNKALYSSSYMTHNSDIKAKFINDLDNFIRDRMWEVINEAVESLQDPNFRELYEDLKENRHLPLYSAVFRMVFGSPFSEGLSVSEPDIKNTPSQKVNFSFITGIFWNSLRGSGEIEDSKSLYITWGLFEDKILNPTLGSRLAGEEGRPGVEWNSHGTYVDYDINLLDRQYAESIKSGKFVFLYPLIWNRKDKAQSYNYKSARSSAGDLYSDCDVEAKEGKIPLRELFIQVELIKEGFKKNSTMNGAIKYILEQINISSYRVFNLSFGSNTTSGETISIVNMNRLKIENDDKDESNTFIEKLFTFKPMSPNTIVKGYNLSYNTPSSEYQSMLSINSMASGRKAFPVSDVIDGYINMKDLDKSEEEELDNLFVEYMPTIRELPHVDIDAEYANLQEEHAADILAVDKQEVDQLDDDFVEEFEGHLTEGTQIAQTFEETPAGEDTAIGTKELPDHVSKYQDTDPDKDLILCSDIYDYYGKVAKIENFTNRESVLFPATLSLDIYGISSLAPTNCIRVDYVPERYFNKMYFQIMKVTHKLDSSWTTALELQYRISMPKTTKNGKERKTYLDYKDLYIAKSYLKHLKKWNSVKHIFTKLRPGVVKNSFIDGIIVCEIAKDTKVFYLTDTMPKMGSAVIIDREHDETLSDSVGEIVEWYPSNLTYASEHDNTGDSNVGPNVSPEGHHFQDNPPDLFTSKRVYKDLKKGQKVTIFFYKEFWIFMTETDDKKIPSSEEVVAAAILLSIYSADALAAIRKLALHKQIEEEAEAYKLPNVNFKVNIYGSIEEEDTESNFLKHKRLHGSTQKGWVYDKAKFVSLQEKRESAVIRFSYGGDTDRIMRDGMIRIQVFCTRTGYKVGYKHFSTKPGAWQSDWWNENYEGADFNIAPILGHFNQFYSKTQYYDPDFIPIQKLVDMKSYPAKSKEYSSLLEKYLNYTVVVKLYKRYYEPAGFRKAYRVKTITLRDVIRIERRVLEKEIDRIRLSSQAFKNIYGRDKY